MLRKGEPKRRISLGFPCVSDAQCMRNDENSRCLHGICDCQPNNKTIDQCTAKTRGCLQNTFQVSKFDQNMLNWHCQYNTIYFYKHKWFKIFK